MPILLGALVFIGVLMVIGLFYTGLSVQKAIDLIVLLIVLGFIGTTMAVGALRNRSSKRLLRAQSSRIGFALRRVTDQRARNRRLIDSLDVGIARVGAEGLLEVANRIFHPDDIRAASGTAAFSAISESFADDVYATLPADADVERMSPTRFIALVPRSQGGMREILSVLLERVSTLEEHQAIPIRLSASIGCAQATSTGYDLDVLLDAASEAAVVAHAEGGDRWERVRGEG